MFNDKNLMTANEVIMKICPETRTIEQLFSDDEGQVQLLCRYLNCERTALLLTQSDVMALIKTAPICEEIKSKFSNYGDILENCEYPEDTARKGEEQ